MIEKLGHTKRMQTMRREWIDEEKRKVFDGLDASQDIPETRNLPTRIPSEQNGTALGNADGFTALEQTNDGLGSADDLFIPDPEGASRPPPASHPEPDDDDLDDLLREQDEAGPVSAPTSRTPAGGPDDFDAEYEAMNELGM